MNIHRLTVATGSRIDGIDLRRVSTAQIEQIRSTLVTRGVVLMRDQHLDPAAQIEFGKAFGPLVHTDGAVNHGVAGKNDLLPSWPEIFRVSNNGKGPGSTEMWHADNCHVPRPTAVSILAAQVLPEVGGDTLFSNQYVAYDTLSPSFKRLLRGLRLRHSGSVQIAYRGGPAEQAPFAFHPVVRTHGESGLRALFIGGPPGPARPHFDGMTEAESRPLQQFLLEHSIQPDRCYRHMWQPGDVLLWDNRCTLHYAVHDHGGARRDMNRVTTQGEVPFEAPYENDDQGDIQ